MQIFKNLKLTLSGSLSFIKKKSSLLLFLLFFSTPSFALTYEEHKFVNDIRYCLKQIYLHTPDKYIKVNFDIIIAMAVLESDFGRSRFAVEGNNFFGIRTYDLTNKHIKPKGYENPDFGILTFKYFCSSVRYTLDAFTNHPAYDDFRQYGNVEDIWPWAEDPQYVGKIRERIQTIKENNH